MMTAEEYMATHTPLNNADHPLTEDEKREWWEAMTEVDLAIEKRKSEGRYMTLEETTREYYEKQYLKNK